MPKNDPALSEIIVGYGDRLRLAREALGFNQKQFATALGISNDRLNHWEKGRHPPSAEHLALLKSKFNIGSDWILSGDYSVLTVKMLQSIVSRGASAGALEPARELRAAIRDLPSGRRKGMLHEAQSPAPAKTIQSRD